LFPFEELTAPAFSGYGWKLVKGLLHFEKTHRRKPPAWLVAK
jgi:hypothetical protein